MPVPQPVQLKRKIDKGKKLAIEVAGGNGGNVPVISALAQSTELINFVDPHATVTIHQLAIMIREVLQAVRNAPALMTPIVWTSSAHAIAIVKRHTPLNTPVSQVFYEIKS